MLLAICSIIGQLQNTLGRMFFSSSFYKKSVHCKNNADLNLAFWPQMVDSIITPQQSLSDPSSTGAQPDPLNAGLGLSVTFSRSLSSSCLVAGAGRRAQPGHIHLGIMHFGRGGGGGCICPGLHLSSAADESPMSSISRLPVTPTSRQ